MVVWAVDGSGPAGVLALAEDWAADRRYWCLACVVRGRGWLACLVLGVEDTPAVVGCCGLVVVVVCWWWVPSRVLVCVWGWHAVGVLG